MSNYSTHHAQTACLLLLRKKKPDWAAATYAVILAQDLHKLAARKHLIDLHLCNYGYSQLFSKRMDGIAKRIIQLGDELQEYNLKLVSNHDPRGAALRLESTNATRIPTNSFTDGWAL